MEGLSSDGRFRHIDYDTPLFIVLDLSLSVKGNLHICLDFYFYNVEIDLPSVRLERYIKF
jgi:hypothetical protein